jgi:hypothetical protein
MLGILQRRTRDGAGVSQTAAKAAAATTTVMTITTTLTKESPTVTRQLSGDEIICSTSKPSCSRPEFDSRTSNCHPSVTTPPPTSVRESLVGPSAADAEVTDVEGRAIKVVSAKRQSGCLVAEVGRDEDEGSSLSC